LSLNGRSPPMASAYPPTSAGRSRRRRALCGVQIRRVFVAVRSTARPLDSNRLYATLPNRYSTTIQNQPQKRRARQICRARRRRDARPRRKTERGSLSPRELERKAPRSVWATQLPASRPIRWIVRESREANRTDFARIPSDGLRDAPRASTDGLARFLSDKLRSRSRASIGRTHIRNPLARFPTDGFRPH